MILGVLYLYTYLFLDSVSDSAQLINRLEVVAKREFERII